MRTNSTFTTDSNGDLVIASMPFGIYQLHVSLVPFAPFDESLAIRSAIPQQQQIHLTLTAVRTQVQVNAGSALIDPTQASSPVQIEAVGGGAGFNGAAHRCAGGIAHVEAQFPTIRLSRS